MSNISEKQVLDALSNVIEPELKRDMVSLNMIKDIEIKGDNINFTVVLTTTACPLKQSIKDACENAVKDILGAHLTVTANLTARVTTVKRQGPILQNVKNIIAVASGKGGVGKSTVASNMAIALSKTGAKVGLVDADIYGPSVPLMFDLMDEHPAFKEVDGKQIIIPPVKYGIKVLSIGFFVEPDKALVWRGPMAASALKQLFTDADWGELDYLVIDLPPGTGDIQLTLVQLVPITGVVIVTTPQKVALADAYKGIGMFLNKDINVPILGLVENMAYFTPPELPNNKYYIFGKDGGKNMAEKYNVRFLGQLPITESVCDAGDKGAPIALEDNTPISNAFLEMAQNVASAISMRNANVEPTKIVEIKYQ